MPYKDHDKSFHTLVHIGCGPTPNIDEYTALAKQVWLVDADEDVIAQLAHSQQQGSDGQIQQDSHIHQALVDSQEGKGTFYRYSLAWANGLMPLDEKTQQLYPGLHYLGATEHATIGIIDLLQHCLPAEVQQKHILLLDVGQLNANLLQALGASALLPRFERIIVLPTYRKKSAITIPPVLYEPEQSELPLTLPPNALVLASHPLIKAIKNLEQEASKERKKWQQQLTECEQQLAERDKQLAERTQQRDSKNKQLEEVTQQRDEKAQQADNAAKARDELKQQLAERDKQLAEITQQRDEKAHQANNATKVHDELKQQLAERDKQLAERTQQRDEKAQQADHATKARDELKQQLAERDKQLAELQQRDEKAEQLERLSSENTELKHDKKLFEKEMDRVDG